VSDPSPLLDRAGIEEAFRRLGDRLARRGVVADLYVFGGAAMALAYDSRRATRDVDALFKPHGIVLEEALAVATDLGLPPVVAERAGQLLCRTWRGLGGLPGIRPPGPPPRPSIFWL
jgi:hypothetical protein